MGERYKVIQSAIWALAQAAASVSDRALIVDIEASPQGYYRLVREVITQAGLLRGAHLRITAEQIKKVRKGVTAGELGHVSMIRKVPGGTVQPSGCGRGVGTDPSIWTDHSSRVRPTFSKRFRRHPNRTGFTPIVKDHPISVSGSLLRGVPVRGGDPQKGVSVQGLSLIKQIFEVEESDRLRVVQLRHRLRYLRGEKWSRQVSGSKKVHSKSWQSWRTSAIMATRLRRCSKPSSDITQQNLSSQLSWGGCPSVPVEKIAAQAATTQSRDKPSPGSQVGEWKESCTAPSAPSKPAYGSDKYHYQ